MALLSITRKSSSGAAPSMPQYDLEIPNTEVRIDASAAKRILDLLSQPENQGKRYLRVGIKGGGCSGLSYHFEMQADKNERDLVFEGHGAQICVDPKSLKLIGGSLLIWQESLTRSQFLLVNKDPKKSCSCGQSFSV